MSFIRRADFPLFRRRVIQFWPALFIASAAFIFVETALAAEQADSCVDCHGQESFLVTNKKLYDYFKQWETSVHRQEGVTCVDCHGGNPKVRDKDAAHGTDLAGSKASSAVNFRNIPRTCGECHKDVFRGFRESAHYEHLIAKDQEQQGPTCVTCHGSINVAVLNVNTVESTCAKCHNEKTENGVENPKRARDLLNHFLAVHRYYRYISVRLDSPDSKDYLKQIDKQLHELSIAWHTFDLDEIERQTDTILASLKEKREEVGKLYREKNESVEN